MHYAPTKTLTGMQHDVILQNNDTPICASCTLAKLDGKKTFLLGKVAKKNRLSRQ